MAVSRGLASSSLSGLRSARRIARRFAGAARVPAGAPPAPGGAGHRRGAAAAAAAAGGSSCGSYEYDLLTIGAGSGGVRCSRVSAGTFGARVGIVELPFGFVSGARTGGAGGTCVLRGCVPKKLLIYGGEFANQLNEAGGMGWRVPPGPVPSILAEGASSGDAGAAAVTHDWSALQSKKNAELVRLNGIYKKLLSGAGVDYIEGRGRLVDAHTVDVDGRRITAARILVAVGGTPFKPSIPGAELCITSDEALQLERCPEKIVIVGGGYIALEFAGIFHAFGAEVHVVFRQPKPLRGFDEEVRGFVMEQMAMQGVHFHPSESPTAVEEAEGKGLVFTTDAGTRLEVDQVMLATGRKPNTKNLGLEDVGVDTDAGGVIKVRPLRRAPRRRGVRHAPHARAGAAIPAHAPPRPVPALAPSRLTSTARRASRACTRSAT